MRHLHSLRPLEKPWPPLDLNPVFDKPVFINTSVVRIVAVWVRSDVDPLPDRLLEVFSKTLPYRG